MFCIIITINQIMYYVGNDYIRVCANVSDTFASVDKMLTVAFKAEMCVCEDTVLSFVQENEQMCYILFNPLNGKDHLSREEAMSGPTEVLGFIVRAIDYETGLQVTINNSQGYHVWVYTLNSSGYEHVQRIIPEYSFPPGSYRLNASNPEGLEDTFDISRTLTTVDARPTWATRSGHLKFKQGLFFDTMNTRFTLAAVIKRVGEPDNAILFNKAIFIRNPHYWNTIKTHSVNSWLVPDFPNTHPTPVNEWRFVAVVFDRSAGTRRMYTIPLSFTSEDQVTPENHKYTVNWDDPLNDYIAPITEVLTEGVSDYFHLSDAFMIPAALNDTDIFNLFLKTK